MSGSAYIPYPLDSLDELSYRLRYATDRWAEILQFAPQPFRIQYPPKDIRELSREAHRVTQYIAEFNAQLITPNEGIDERVVEDGLLELRELNRQLEAFSQRICELE